MPEAKPRDTNVPRVLLLLVNDSPNLLVPKAKPRNTNNIYYHYLFSTNVPNYLLMSYIVFVKDNNLLHIGPKGQKRGFGNIFVYFGHFLAFRITV